MSGTRTKLSKYAITPDNRLAYISEANFDMDVTQEYTVWAIGMSGFIHGCLSYLDREKILEGYTIIAKPTKAEFKRYKNLRERWDRLMRGEEDDE